MLNIIIIIGFVMLIAAGLWDADEVRLQRKTKKSTIYLVPSVIITFSIYRIFRHNVLLKWFENYDLNGCDLRDPMSPGTLITIVGFVVAVLCLVKLGKMICYAKIGKSFMSRNK